MENKTQIDDSIRFLNEIHEKVKANIVELVEVKVNNIDGVAIVWEDRLNSTGKAFTVKFNINGQVFTANGAYSRMDILAYQNSAQEGHVDTMIIELVRNAIIETLVKSMKGQILPPKQQTF